MGGVLKNLDLVNKYLLVAFGFCIPVSTALTNGVLALLVMFGILDNISDRFCRWGSVLKTNPVAQAGLVFFLIHVAGIFYSDGQMEKIFESLSDGAKFLFISMVMIYAKDKKFGSVFLLSFVWAMGITLILSYLLWMGLLPEALKVKGNAANAIVFHLHITQNSFMAFAAFIAAVRTREPGICPLHKGVWGVFSVLALFNVLFMVQGRTGHLIVVALVLYYFVTWDRAKSLVTGMVILLAFGTFAWMNPSNPLFSRAQTAIDEVRNWSPDKPAQSTEAIGIRVEWLFNSMQIIRQNIVIGTGTGSFDTTYREFVKHTGMLSTDNPHNEYLMTTVQFGFVGLMVLFGFFAVQWYCAGKYADFQQTIMARGFVLLMLIACMTASPLQDNAEGWFFVFMSGLFFAGSNTNEAASASEKVKEQHI
ncbi:MAG: O-antigen ligase family protein [Desulfotignum sp.]|nr:O-antigen ligase family protein [Desulfotignum sp.]MCF8088745.1 O-antigen ligase family protein [Desulfotignum sp.]MCF8138064.1 O-antigen ligase family protein [Desulfotignum sp.]